MADALPDLSPAELARYSRHLLLDEIGLAGQQRISGARVLVIGAGGLGSPVALYLAAAGVGTLGIADLDLVEAHNLQRQLLHETATIGETKVASAARRLRALNPHVDVVEHTDGVTATNADALFARYDIIVDGTDNFSARYLNNDAAFHAKKPLVYGSVFKFEGHVSVFHPAGGGPCYRCLFPEPPAPGSVPGCGEAGVLGALCGVIGSLQALEALKLIARIGEPLVGRLLVYDALAQKFETFVVARDPACPLCGAAVSRPRPRAAAHEDDPPSEAPPPAAAAEVPIEISAAEAKRRIEASTSRALLVDVREPWETKICRVTPAEFIPMRQIPDRLATLPQGRHLLILCHHGARSLNVTHFLRAHGFSAVSNIRGGIAAWAEELEPAMPRY